MDQGSQLTNRYIEETDNCQYISSTDGLNIFDGLHTRVYRPSTHHMHGYNVQSSFFEDTLGRVWFTTYEALNYYDPRKDDLDYTFLLTPSGDTIKANYKAIALEGSYLFLKAGTYFYIYDVYKEEIVTAYPVNLSDVHELALVRNGGALFVFEEKSKMYSLIRLHEDGTSDTLCSRTDSISAVCPQSDGLLWTGHRDGRISLFDPATCQFLFSDKLTLSAISGMELVSPTRLLVAYSSNELLEYDIPLRQVVRSIYPVNIVTGEPAYSLIDPYLDQDSTLWIGADGQGVFFTSLKPKKFHHILGGSFDRRQVQVTRIIPLPLGEYLILSRGNGILHINIKGDILGHWDELPNVKKPFTSLSGFLVDDQKLLFTGYSKLYMLDWRKGKITPLLYTGTLKDIQIEQLERLANGRIVASCYTNLMMEVVLEGNTYSLRPYGDLEGHVSSATYFKVDADQRIYVSNDEIDLAVLEPTSDRKGHRFSYTLPLGGGVKGLCSDPQGDAIYLCNTQGLYHIDHASRQIRQVMDKNKDKWLAQTIYSVLPDAKGNLWLATNKGLIRYSPADSTAKPFTKMDGIQEMEYNTHACLLEPDGRMFFGGVNGLNHFRPEEVVLSQRAAPIVITDFLVNDVPDSVYQVPEYHHEMILPYARNTISFEFHAIDYANPEATRVKYKLSGVDEHYIESKDMEGFARYANLRPGTYIFSILSANADGQWAEVPREIKIIIRPPFWMTWWFITITSLLIGSTIYMSVRSYFKRKLERKNQLLREQALIIEKQQAVEQERTRIASEMHDDLGSGLTTIRYLSDKALIQAKDKAEAEQIQRIAEHSNKLVRNMSEIIWAMNSRFDNAENLVGYLRRYASEYLEDRQMPLSFKAEGEGMEALTITGEKRRNVFLVFKELLHNAVKYSGAERIDIHISRQDTLTITLREIGGKGFDPEASQDKGNGLYNCRKRIQTIGGRLIFSRTPEAMMSQIVLPLQPVPHV